MMADVVVENERKSCAFFLKRKNRFCRMTVGEGRKYCGEHMIVAGESEKPQKQNDRKPFIACGFCGVKILPVIGYNKHSRHILGVHANIITAADGRKRITCPLDKKHTVFEDQLEKHLKKCNQTKKTQVVYFSAKINSGIPNYEFSPAEKVSLNSVTQKKVSKLIDKVKEYFRVHGPKLTEEVLSHCVFQKELSEMVDKPAILKHLKQQASLVGHIDKLHLLKPSTIFMEFGAGRGKLSHWLQLALGNSAKDVDYLLIDRASNRYKYDRYHRGEDQGPSFQRLNLDIEHLDLSKVPCIENSKHQIVAISKHLCGAATDLTLRCLMETLNNSGERLGQDTIEEKGNDRENKRIKLSPNKSRVKGVVLALCCHHCCSWPQYVGRPFLQNLGFTAEEFHLLSCLSSWATCGIRLKKRRKGIAGQTDNNRVYNTVTDNDSCDCDGNDPNISEEDQGKSESDDEDRWSHYTVSEREEIGRHCKRLIDAGRLWYLESHDFNARLAFYVDSTVSLENAVLLATPKT